MTERAASLELAAAAGLRYVTDDQPGHRRIRRGKGFSFVDEHGAPLGDEARAWAESLVIPPAWTDVWISPARDGHILATGYDDAGRKQYIYHPDWEEARDEVKFERMTSFGRRLPSIRKRIQADLNRPGLDRDKVVALTVAVLDRTLIRVGTRRYVEANESYGLTTITPDNAEVEGREVLFSFAGKSGAEHEVRCVTPGWRGSSPGARTWTARPSSPTRPMTEWGRSILPMSTATCRTAQATGSPQRTSAPGGRAR